MLLIGFTWAGVHASWLLQQKLPANWENKPLVAVGQINSITPTANATNCVVAINKISNGSSAIPFHANARLAWQNPPPLQLDDVWQLTAKLQPAHSSLNPYGFDEEAWLFEHGIRLSGYVISNDSNHLLKQEKFLTSINKIRYAIAAIITTQLQNNTMTGFITALAVGVRDNILPNQWQILRATGTNHLMAIAGLHIGFVSAFIFYMTHWLWRRSAFLTLRFPAPFIAALAALIAAVFYSALAGFALPTQRAIIMLAVILIAVIARRQLVIWHAISLALFIILLIDPLIVLSSSFWLSFVTVALIIFSLSARIATQPKLLRWLKIQAVISIGLIPWMLYFFQQVSLIGILANLIAIPWVGIFVLPLTLLGVISLIFSSHLASIFFISASYFMQWLWLILTKLAAYSWLQWYSAIPNELVLITSVIAVLLILSPRGFPGRWLSGVFILPLLFWPSHVKPDQFKFILLDIGQGLSAVIETSHHVLVYDTGAKYSMSNDAANATIIPFLRGEHFNKIDTLIISNKMPDHLGGANSLLTTLPVQHIITSLPHKFSPAITSACQAGTAWKWDGINFFILDDACTLKISAGNNNVLITSDLTSAQQNNLLRNNRNELKSMILVVPHHGGASAYNANFVSAVAAKYVLFSTGYLNHFHLPNASVLKAYQQLGAYCFNTANEGAISFIVSADKIILDHYRFNHGKYWNVK